MAKILHAFSIDGVGQCFGHPIRWHAQAPLDAVVFSYLGKSFLISNRKLTNEGFAAVLAIARQIEGQMASPGVIHTNNLGGSHGVSRQAAQAVSGNSNQALTGGGGSTAAQYIQHQQAQLAAQQAIYSGYSYRNGQTVTHELEVVKPLKTEGFRCGEILAWRGWRITPQGFLRSMSADVIWGPGEPMDGKTKSTEEHCGVYAYKKLRDFLSQHTDGLDVYGQVALWGDVIEHELGYRAEWAKIISIENTLGKDRTHGFSLPQLREIYKLQ